MQWEVYRLEGEVWAVWSESKGTDRGYRHWGLLWTSSSQHHPNYPCMMVLSFKGIFCALSFDVHLVFSLLYNDLLLHNQVGVQLSLFVVAIDIVDRKRFSKSVSSRTAIACPHVHWLWQFCLHYSFLHMICFFFLKWTSPIKYMSNHLQCFSLPEIAILQMINLYVFLDSCNTKFSVDCLH